MSSQIYLLTIVLPLATILIIFALKYGSAAYQARLRAAADADYRELARQAAAAQASQAVALAAVQADVAELKAALGKVVKILQEVE